MAVERIQLRSLENKYAILLGQRRVVVIRVVFTVLRQDNGVYSIASLPEHLDPFEILLHRGSRVIGGDGVAVHVYVHPGL